MARLSRRLTRIEEPRFAAGFTAVTLLVLVAAYAYAVAVSAPFTPGIIAALALVGIAGSGVIYVWRAVAGASSE